jgi:hypothetical protein
LIEDIVIGVFIGFFLFQGPFIAWKIIKLRSQLSKALKMGKLSLEDLSKKKEK